MVVGAPERGYSRLTMTDDDKAACIGQLVSDYSKTKEMIALLCEHLRKQGEQVETLGTRLKALPTGVEFAEDGFFQFRPYGAASLQRVPLIDLNETRQALLDLRAAQEKREALERRLQDAGLGNLI